MPRPRRNTRIASWWVFGTVIAAVVVGGSILLASQLSGTSSGQTCDKSSHANHVVVIRGDTVTPSHTVAKRCDQLTITNYDGTNRLVAFGEHEHHTPYDGVTEKLLSQGQSLKVTLDKTGTYRFHDHLHDEVQGTFTVDN